MVKKLFIVITMCAVSISTMAQGYNTEKTSLTNFLVRMYENAPFEGVRAVDDYNQQYLISVLTLEKAKYPNESAMFRVAGVKATSEKSDGTGDTEMIETINEKSVGFVKSLELLTNFDIENGRMVFIYSTPIR